MKKYFLLLSIVLISLAAQAADITKVLELDNKGNSGKTDGNYGLAVESYGIYYPCYYKIDGTNVTFVIYNTFDFSVKEEFTLSNILADADDISIHWVVDRLSETVLFRGNDPEGKVFLTKNVFNNDDNWEVMLYSYKDKEGYENMTGNYKVVNEKGEAVTSFSFPEDGKPWTVELDYMIFPDNSYIFKSTYDGPSQIYSFKGNGAGVKSVMATSDLKVYPNPLRRGETLTVRLPKEADENSMLLISDMEGRPVCRQKIDAGATTVTVEAGTLFTGTYIYTLISPDRQPLSGKLIVE